MNNTAIEQVELAELSSLFKKQTITAYGFTRLLVAKLKLSGKYAIDKKLIVERTYELGSRLKYKELLNDVGYKVWIDYIASPEIDLALSTMKSFGMIMDTGLAHDKVSILIDRTEANKIVSAYTNDISNIMDDLVLELLS